LSLDFNARYPYEIERGVHNIISVFDRHIIINQTVFIMNNYITFTSFSMFFLLQYNIITNLLRLDEPLHHKELV